MLKGIFGKLSRSKNDTIDRKKSDIEEEEFVEVNDEFEGESFEGFDELGDDLEDESDLEKTGKFTEIESRIKDLENEVGLISSKLNTIKAENEEIGKRLEEIEENIRKLLGIYEMVTEGINPFAADVGGLSSEDGFGIFGSLNKNKGDEDVPDEILSKEPESFFEDLDDDEDLEVSTAEDFSAEEDSEESPEEKFKKLKKELEGSESADEQIKEEFAEDIPEDVFEEEKPHPESGVVQEQVEELQTDNEVRHDVHDAGVQYEIPEPSVSRRISAPYLKSIKRDYVSDILVLKWLDYLVGTFGLKRMAELLDFYVDIGWISREVKEFLINCSRGYTLRDMQFVEDNVSNMPTLKDHIKSLIFISKLSGEELKIEEIEKVIKEIEELEKEVGEVVPLDHGAFNISC